MTDFLRFKMDRFSSRLKWTYHIRYLIETYNVPPGLLAELAVSKSIGVDGEWLVFVTDVYRDNSLEDLIYVEPAKPDKWRLERGHANWLGNWHQETDDLRIWNNPMQWLSSGGVGVMPLNQSSRNQLAMVSMDLKTVL